jgi:tetratricopeptide repeat protein 21B
VWTGGGDSGTAVTRRALAMTHEGLPATTTTAPATHALPPSHRYQQCLLGEFGAASESYRQASKLDESNVSALAGMIYCQICEGQYEDAEQQLELFRMIQESVGRTSELAFLDALLAW